MRAIRVILDMADGQEYHIREGDDIPVPMEEVPLLLGHPRASITIDTGCKIEREPMNEWEDPESSPWRLARVTVYARNVVSCAVLYDAPPPDGWEHDEDDD